MAGPPNDFDLAIVLVHGVGEPARGDTLESALLAFDRWFAEVSYNNLDLDGESHQLSAEIIRIDPRDHDSDAPAEAILEVKLVSPGNETKQRWLIMEAWWAQAFKKPTFRETSNWVVSVAPQILSDHFHKRMLLLTAQMWPLSQPIELALYFLQATILALSVLLLPLLQLATLLPTIGRTAKRLANLITEVAGHSFVLLENEVRRKQILDRVDSVISEAQSRNARVVCLIGHSQGAAIAHYVARKLDITTLDSLITFGSAFEKLTRLEMLRLLPHKLARLRATPFMFFMFALFFTLYWNGWHGLVLLCVYAIPASLAESLFTRMRTAGRIVVASLLLVTVGLAYKLTRLFPTSVDPVPVISLILDVAVMLWVFTDIRRFKAAAIRDEAVTRSVFAHILEARAVTWGHIPGLISVPVQWVIGEFTAWKNLFASRDPVPNGPLFLSQYRGLHDVLRGNRSTEDVVANRGSLIGDHTAYWSNLDQFVTKVMWQALMISRITWSHSPIDRAVLEIETRADRERPGRVNSLSWARFALQMCAVVSALLCMSYVTDSAPWATAIVKMLSEWGWVRLSLHPDLVARVASLAAVAACSAAGIVVAMRTWARWDRLAIRQCLRGLPPDQSRRERLFLLSVAVSLAVTFSVTASLLYGSILTRG